MPTMKIKLVLSDIVFWRTTDTRNVTDDVHFVDEFTYECEYVYDDECVNFDEVQDIVEMDAFHAMNIDPKQWWPKEYKRHFTFAD
jgi:hypothetical protein